MESPNKPSGVLGFTQPQTLHEILSHLQDIENKSDRQEIQSTNFKSLNNNTSRSRVMSVPSIADINSKCEDWGNA